MDGWMDGWSIDGRGRGRRFDTSNDVDSSDGDQQLRNLDAMPISISLPAIAVINKMLPASIWNPLRMRS